MDVTDCFKDPFSRYCLGHLMLADKCHFILRIVYVVDAENKIETKAESEL